MGIYRPKYKDPKTGHMRESKTWWIDYYYCGKRIREKVGPSKKKAEQALRSRLGDIEQGRFDLRKTQKSILFKDLANRFYEEYWVPEMRAKYQNDRDSHRFDKNCRQKRAELDRLSKRFGNKVAGVITSAHIIEFRGKRITEGVKKSTVNREMACLKKLFNWGKSMGLVTQNPLEGIKFYNEKKGKGQEKRKVDRYLSKDEIEALLDACPPQVRGIVQVALNTGMRREEIFKIQKSDIDFEKGTLYIPETKSGYARTIPISGNPSLTEILKEAIKSSGESPYVFPSHRGNGRYTKIDGLFKKALKDAGLADSDLPRLKDFRFHDLRHTWASHMVMTGTDILTVKELGGWETLDMVLVYAHLAPDHKVDAIAKIESIMNPDHGQRGSDGQSLVKVIEFGHRSNS